MSVCDDQDFWSNNKDSIVQRASLAIAVYSNKDGDIVVRQDNDFGDAIVVIAVANARRVAEAILAEEAILAAEPKVQKSTK